MSIRNVSTIILVLTCFWSVGQPFVDAGISFSGAYGIATWCDYDNDNDFDVIIAQGAPPYGYSAGLFRNDNGVFSFVTQFPNIYRGALEWGDYNNDSKLDLMITGFGMFEASHVYQNMGNGNFTALSQNFLEVNDGAGDWGDYNNDGRLDFIISGGDIPDVKLYQNLGSGTFLETGTGTTSIQSGNINWCDVDGDNDADLFFCGRAGDMGPEVAIVYNNQNGTFTQGFDFNSNYNSDADWGDFDNDGDLDLVTVDYNSALVYRNNGNFNFVQVSSFAGLNSAAISSGDYNNDGLLDLALTGQGDNGVSLTRVYKNNGNMTFTLQNFNIPGVGNYPSIQWVDFDNDGDMDLFISGYDDNYTAFAKIFENQISAANTPPTKPTGLQVLQDQNKLLVSWSSSGDNETDTLALTYNVCIGTSSANCDILSPGSDLSTGYHRLLEPGNAGTGLSYYLNNLSPGTYYVRVQAIDNSYKGSIFSDPVSIWIGPTSTFSVSNDTITANSSILIKYNGTANSTASYYWNFDGGIVVSGSGQGPYYVKWNTLGLKNITLHVSENSTNSDTTSIPVLIDTIIGTDDWFTEILTGIPGVKQGFSTWADYDEDGDLDIFVTGKNNNDIAISELYRNDGIIFQETGYFNAVFNSFARWSDYNCDNKPDLIEKGVSGYTNLYAYKNNGNGTFSNSNNGLPSQIAQGSFACSDLDNDGDIDITVPQSTMIEIYYQNANHSYYNSGNSLWSSSSKSVSSYDYDNDMDNDILIPFAYSGSQVESRLYRNDLNNIFSGANSGISQYNGNIACGDYNSDGFIDILFTGGNSTGLFINQGNNTFSELASPVGDLVNSYAAWGDFNNDGTSDLLIAGNDGAHSVTKVFQNNSGLNDLYLPLEGVEDCSVSWGDLDNDGDLDILLNGFNGSSSVTKIYRNNCTHPNMPPSVPQNLSVTQDGSKFLFKWNKSSDQETGQEAIAYNLLIYDKTANKYLRSPLADTTSGKLFLPAHVNMCFDTSFYFCPNNNAGIGDSIYWQVQAVDQGFMGSGFSEKTFLTVGINSCFVMDTSACNSGNVTVTYSGNADNTANFYWDFDGGTIISGSGIGPYTIYWQAPGIKTVNLSVEKSGVLSDTTSNNILVTPCFSHESATFIELMESNLSLCDYDNDNDLDILMSGSSGAYSATTQLYKNNGNGTYTAVSTGIVGVSSGSHAWGDYNKDGRLDLLIAGDNSNYSPTTKIYKNNSNGTFTAVNVTLAGVTDGSVSWVDFDNDGDLDIFLTGSNNGRLYRNNGPTTFTLVNTPFASFSYSTAAWGDYDQNGYPDLLVCGNAGGDLYSIIYKNDDGVNFYQQTDIQLPGVYRGSVDWGDYDNDGDIDILLSGQTINNVYITKIYRNDGNNQFTDINAGLTGIYESTTKWGDFENDGNLDILLFGYSESGETIKIFRNSGSDIFTDIYASIEPLSYADAAWGDLDNDKDLDIIMSGYQSYPAEYNIYKNLNAISNNQPSPPANISAQQDSTVVTIKWNPANDVETASNSITYNVAIGTNYNMINTVSPTANVSSGFNKISDFGYCHTDTFFIINNLAPGKYYFRVQSIDNGFLGSVFSPMDSITVLPVENQLLIINNNLIQLFPNPAYGKIYFQTMDQNEEQIYQLQINDLFSRNVVVSTSIKNNSAIDVSSLEPGIYLYSVYQNKTNIKTGKLIILHE